MVDLASATEAVDVVEALAWPGVVLLLVGLFRRPLLRLFDRDDVEVRGPAGLAISARGRGAATAALVEASASKQDAQLDEAQAQSGVEVAAAEVESLGRAPQVLWVDDRPSNNRLEAAALSALGMRVQLSVSTDDALARMLREGPYDVIISDMGRPPDAQAGYTLLDELRARGVNTPVVFYAASRTAHHFDLSVSRGAEGCTNRPQELIEMVGNAIRRRESAR